MTTRSGRLQEYRRKRDFRKTAEPSGDDDRSTRRRVLEFVIQKHAASHLHYDLRLEVDGVMRSWAVPKGPSLDPSVKRLAMQVEDHPMGYNAFEGTIPKGEYGGGTVMLWDRGTYRPDEREPGEDDEAAVRRGLRAGKLSFTFEGERLRGSFALVRTERGAKPKWLLFKHRDDDARTGREVTDVVKTSVTTGRTMEEIAGEKDRVWRSNRGGRKGGEASATAAAGDGVALAPVRPTPSRALPGEGAWQFEPWHGGERVLAFVTPQGARIIDGRERDVSGRHGDVVEALAAFATRVKSSFVLDGEFADEVLHVSDLLLHDEVPLVMEPRRKRRERLEALLKRRRVSGVKLSPATSDGSRALRAAARAGHAGVLAWKLDAPYEPGAKSRGVLRIPVE
jgi:bifunctional non-homologous end joining protein LigD